MAAHNTSPLLKYGLVSGLVFLVVVLLLTHSSHKSNKSEGLLHHPHLNDDAQTATHDSAAESLDTLTAELAQTRQQIQQVASDNANLKNQNTALAQQANHAQNAKLNAFADEIAQLKNQIQLATTSKSDKSDYVIQNNAAAPITTVPDLTDSITTQKKPFNWLGNTVHNSLNFSDNGLTTPASDTKPKPIPYYTIAANATAVNDKLMTALVGRIPIKGIVTDPYPFKIVFADDTLAANGFRIPHLQQMIVSGYTEGDLNLVSVRGWVTSLTFVFEDGTITTITSNDNDIGHFTKANALGYLSDQQGNPFLRGKLITNAPAYLGMNVALGAAQGAAKAYSQAQTTAQSTLVGTSSTAVTGSPGAYISGEAASNAASQAQQWWQEREENSFDAVYVPAGQRIVVNFAKEIPIDYNPIGRKIDYAQTNELHPHNRTLD